MSVEGVHTVGWSVIGEADADAAVVRWYCESELMKKSRTWRSPVVFAQVVGMKAATCYWWDIAKESKTLDDCGSHIEEV